MGQWKRQCGLRARAWTRRRNAEGKTRKEKREKGSREASQRGASPTTIREETEGYSREAAILALRRMHGTARRVGCGRHRCVRTQISHRRWFKRVECEFHVQIKRQLFVVLTVNNCTTSVCTTHFYTFKKSYTCALSLLFFLLRRCLQDRRHKKRTKKST